ncbi:hypothetical protein [Bdellovibrio sp. HCB337]|uniref:hypothetical protein n=1 Tax=Bdellovibrio sp. HCB337 TaxID=3394358 RepID=UPI0039A74848
MAPNVRAEETPLPNGETKDIDLEITNAKMRAESGSKSKWSIKADISYNGGNLEEPFGEVRPNYAGVSSQDNSTSIAGTVAVAYRWSVADTLRAGTGILVLTPFHNTWEELTNSSGVRKTDISNPYLEYSRAMRIGGFQNIFDTYYMQYTQSAYTEANYVGLYDINHTVLYKFEPTEWELGLVTDLSYIFFSDGKDPTDTLTNPVNGRTDYTIGLYPFVEYAFNGRYSFRTVFRFLTFDHYRYDDPWTFYRQLYTQSVGLGIAITRDVYLYPNIQFAPEHLSPERTNVGLNTTINIF